MFSVPSSSSSIFVQAVWRCGTGHGLHNTGWAGSRRGFPPESSAVAPEPNREVIGYLTHPSTFSPQLWLQAALIPCDNLQRTCGDPPSPPPPQGSARPARIYFSENTQFRQESLTSCAADYWSSQWSDCRQLWSIEVIVHSCHVCCCFFKRRD